MTIIPGQPTVQTQYATPVAMSSGFVGITVSSQISTTQANILFTVLPESSL